METRIFLTGATGFLGYYLVHQLTSLGYRLRLLYRPDSDRDHLRGFDEYIEWVAGDILDIASLEEGLRGCDTVIHAAAEVSFQARDRKRLYAVNESGTKNVVNLALETGVKRLIHLSSVAALDRTGDQAISERNRWQEQPATTHYARSKFAAEREVWRGQAEGLSVAALYPSIVLGGGDWLGRSTPSLFHAAAKGRGYYSMGHGGFVDVRDVARAVALVLKRDRDGDRFLLNAENHSWKKVLTDIADSVNAKTPTVAIAPWMSALAWPFTTAYANWRGKDASLTRDTHRTAQAYYAYDGNLITRETDFTYRPLSTTITETGQRYLATAPRSGFFFKE